MALLGLNFDPSWYHNPVAEIPKMAAIGCRGIRVVLRPDRDDRVLFRAAHDLGMEVLGLHTRASQLLGQTVSDAVGAYLYIYGDLIDIYEMCNEPDQDPSAAESSDIMTPDEVSERISAAAGYFPPDRLCAAGFSSGHPEWIGQLKARAVAKLGYLSCHFYGKWSSEVAPIAANGDEWGNGPVDALIEGYAAFGKPLIVSEFGAPSTELRNPHIYLFGMAARLLSDPRIHSAYAFTWHGVEGFNLTDGDGMPTIYYNAFKAAAALQDAVVTQVAPNHFVISSEGRVTLTLGGGTVAEDNFNIGPGFRERMQELGWHPAGPEVYWPGSDPAVYSICVCREGVLFWASATNEVIALPKA